MFRTSDLKVLIAGVGIGGLTALRARGINAQLFEQAEAFRQIGAGIQLSSNAIRILRSLGLGEALARACVYPEGRDYRAWDDGDRLYYIPLCARAEAQFGAPYYHAHLLDVLLGGVANTGFRLNARIEGFAQTASPSR
jgi:2-polyprenyl-6-methoxyphenol hydroxylase-like FAD-dependent oxidoreductase